MDDNRKYFFGLYGIDEMVDFGAHSRIPANDDMRTRVESQLVSNFETHLRSHVGSQLHPQFQSHLKSNMNRLIRHRTDPRLYENVPNDPNFRNQVRSNLYSRLGSYLFSHLPPVVQTQFVGARATAATRPVINAQAMFAIEHAFGESDRE
jgi:hypothetical protein